MEVDLHFCTYLASCIPSRPPPQVQPCTTEACCCSGSEAPTLRVTRLTIVAEYMTFHISTGGLLCVWSWQNGLIWQRAKRKCPSPGFRRSWKSPANPHVPRDGS